MNECGDCTACCVLSVVEELDKKAGEHCFNCVDNGCKIYGKHPQVCKDFNCAYIQGGTNVELRPDNCGVMFSKKNERIFVGTVVPEVTMTDIAIGQIVSFKEQGYSVVMLKLGERPHVEPAEGHNKEEIYKEYLNILKNGNV
jgi:hypothetical protein